MKVGAADNGDDRRGGGVAARLALPALHAFAPLRNHDRVAAALLSDRLELFLPPQRRRKRSSM